MHELGYIHRDLKPANLMLGHGKRENIVYLIDFGLAKKIVENGFPRFNDPSTMAPRKMAGTPIYSSINAHMASGGKTLNTLIVIEYFKRDDLESMMYVLI
jgi:serine/threonine protein kinase